MIFNSVNLITEEFLIVDTEAKTSTELEVYLSGMFNEVKDLKIWGERVIELEERFRLQGKVGRLFNKKVKKIGDIILKAWSGKRCANCGGVDIQLKLKKCSGCEKVWYCKVECQKSHWKQHKAQCKKLKVKPVEQDWEEEIVFKLD